MSSTEAPPSTRDAAPLSARGEPRSMRAPTSVRMDELAQLYRKIADMQSQLAETEARLEKALRESAGADEMVGQMLARIGEVEGRLAASQKQVTDAESRTASAESRAGELTAQLGKARAAHAEIAERLRGAESRLTGDRREHDRLRAELAAARTEATVAIAAAEEAQDGLLKEREQVQMLRAELSRETSARQRDREERESLRLRVSDLAVVCEERDQALAREEQLEAELEAARRETAETVARASSGAHRLGDQIAGKSERIEALEGELAEARSRLVAAEKETASARREIAALRDEAEALRARATEAEAFADEAARACDRAKDALDAVTRDKREIEERLTDAELRVEAIANAMADVEQRADEAEARREASLRAHVEAEELAREVQRASEREIESLRAAVDAARARVGDLEVERELHDGLDARAKAAHETEIGALVAAHAAEVERLRASIDEAGQAAARSHYEVLTLRGELLAARRERDAAVTERDTIRSANEGDGRRLRREIADVRALADDVHTKFRSAVADVARTISELERREAEIARARSAALGTALDLLDQAALAEDDLAGVVHRLGRDSDAGAEVVGGAPDASEALREYDDDEGDRETQIFYGVSIGR